MRTEKLKIVSVKNWSIFLSLFLATTPIHANAQGASGAHDSISHSTIEWSAEAMIAQALRRGYCKGLLEIAITKAGPVAKCDGKAMKGKSEQVPVSQNTAFIFSDETARWLQSLRALSSLYTLIGRHIYARGEYIAGASIKDWKEAQIKKMAETKLNLGAPLQDFTKKDIALLGGGSVLTIQKVITRQMPPRVTTKYTISIGNMSITQSVE